MVAFLDDQVSVKDWPSVMEVGDAETVTVGTAPVGIGAGVDVTAAVTFTLPVCVWLNPYRFPQYTEYPDGPVAVGVITLVPEREGSDPL